MKRLFALAMLLLLMAIPTYAQNTVLQQADAAYAEKSYARALDLYRQALANGQALDADEAHFRIAVSLGETQQWSAAIEAGQTLLDQTTWKARVLYWFGRLYTKVPDQAYRVNGRTYYGEDYPHVEGADRPQQTYIGEENAQKTLDYLEQAKVRVAVEADLMTRARFAGPVHPLTHEEERDLDFDLAAFLPTRQLSDFIQQLEQGKGGDENIDPTQPYSRDWTLPKKVLWLYNDIPRIDDSDSRHDSALALLAKGLFVRAYRMRLDAWAPKYNPDTQQTVKRPYPFDSLDPITSWGELVGKFPHDPIADKGQLLIAQAWQQRGDQVKALAAYRALVETFPRSRYVSDSRGAIQQITRHELSLSVQGQQRPGTPAKILVSTRNLTQVAFFAYKIRLENYLTDPAHLNSPDTMFTEFQENFGSIDTAVRGFGAPIARWTMQAQDKGDYQGAQQTIDTPLKDLGAYVVVSESDGLKYAQLIVITDLAILKKTDRDNSFVYIADARTGAAVTAASVVLKETYNDNGTNRVDSKGGHSDDGGFFDKDLKRGRNIYSSQIQAFAWLGDRYAITGSSWNGGYNDNRDEFKIYSYTDRPVYRPAQKVYFRQILTRRVAGGDQQPFKKAPVHVTVTNPQGEKVYESDLTSSEFGTINGSFDLPAGAPLGEYNVEANVQQTNANIAGSGSSRFRVEEYKRPEFEVTVDAPDRPLRPGETVAARISAQYYFGAPVPNAKVKYTIRRSVWWADYHFPRPYEWLYSYWGAGDYDTGRRNVGGEGAGTIVKEGEVTTDAHGLAEVSFQATDPDNSDNPNEWWRRYANPLYSIEVEATDSSRRTIEGQGQVRVARQEFFAFLDAKRGFYQKGDHVEVELRTQDANEHPHAAPGKMVVYRLLPGDKEEKVFEEPIRTDDAGKAFWTWEATTSGQFRVAFEATDSGGQKVEASTEIWVAGPELNAESIRLRGVTIVLEKRDYKEGDTLKALLVADAPDTTVLLTQEAGGDILRRDIIHITGNTRAIEVPITHEHVPNFALAAALVKDFQVYQAQEEVFVPPANQLLNVSVTSDKAEYKPGEHGTFTVHATDANGNPAHAELSLALFDSSLLYIQKDYAPDIRLFYYGERRAISVQLDSSQSGDPQGRQEDTNQYQQYEGHGFELPDDLGQLQLDPGAAFGGWWGGFGRGGARRGIVTHFAIGPEFGAADADAATTAPMAAPAAPAALGMLFRSSNGAAAQNETSAGEMAAAPVRSNFAETAYWSPAVVTENGTATVQVTFPDSLTRWRASARGLTQSAQVGAGDADVETHKNLLVRLQAPRFFVQRDTAVLTANVHNYLSTAKQVRVTLNLESGTAGAPTPLSTEAPTGLQLTGTNLSQPTGEVTIPAGGEARVNWVVRVTRDGSAKIRMSAQTNEESDAVEMSFPVLVHGVQRFASQSGVLRDNGHQSITIQMPAQRRLGSSQLNAQFNPSLAATTLDALPYLADYPYGCVEQTTSRFVPSVVVARTLREAGINLDTLRQRAQAYAAESHTEAVGAQVQNTGYSYPRGMPNARNLQEMSSQLWHGERWHNPVFDKPTLDRMVNEGLQRLYAMQRSDGGWGWWQGSPQSDAYMSAYVMYGLATARDAGVSVKPDVLSRGFNYLEGQMKDEENLHLLATIANSLSMRPNVSTASRGIIAGRMFEQRARLTAYSKSMLAMSLWRINEKEKAGVIVRNLENTAEVDAANGTAHWRQANQWWYWWNNDIETNAIALRAFLMIDRDNRLTPMLMKWLVVKARGNHWRSTKETAEAVYSLSEYSRVFHELDADYTLRVSLNGRLARTYHVTRDNALFFDNRFIAGDLFLENGDNALTIEKTGRGTLYWSAASEYFSLEEPIKASGNEISIHRRFFRLTRNPEVQPEQSDNSTTGTVTSAAPAVPGIAPRLSPGLGGRIGRPIGIVPPFPHPVATPVPFEFTRTELHDNDQLQSGDLVEVELTIQSNNDYEYLVFEDMKAAGMEPVDIRSGGAWGDGLSSNVELRDEKVAFFVDSLPQGTRVLRYRMRVEIPGQWHALPTNGYAMYAPEVRAISDESRFAVRD